jgi:hypothetical protein
VKPELRAELIADIKRWCWRQVRRALVLGLAVLGIAFIVEGNTELHPPERFCSKGDLGCDFAADGNLFGWPMICLGIAILLCLAFAYVLPLLKLPAPPVTPKPRIPEARARYVAP